MDEDVWQVFGAVVVKLIKIGGVFPDSLRSMNRARVSDSFTPGRRYHAH